MSWCTCGASGGMDGHALDCSLRQPALPFACICADPNADPREDCPAHRFRAAARKRTRKFQAATDESYRPTPCYIIEMPDGSKQRIHGEPTDDPETIAAIQAVIAAAQRMLSDEDKPPLAVPPKPEQPQRPGQGTETGQKDAMQCYVCHDQTMHREEIAPGYIADPTYWRCAQCGNTRCGGQPQGPQGGEEEHNHPEGIAYYTECPACTGQPQGGEEPPDARVEAMHARYQGPQGPPRTTKLDGTPAGMKCAYAWGGYCLHQECTEAGQCAAAKLAHDLGEPGEAS